MKKVLSLVLSICMMVGIGASVFAAKENDAPTGSSGATGSITLGESGRDIVLKGNVKPSILSVTIPSYIPFDMDKNIDTENKVLSPRVTVKNNSHFDVSVEVLSTVVDLSSMPGISWGTDLSVSSSEIIVGFKSSPTMPQNLALSKWLIPGSNRVLLTSLTAQSEDSLYVVGALGSNVPENKSFTVTPTLIARVV